MRCLRSSHGSDAGVVHAAADFLWLLALGCGLMTAAIAGAAPAPDTARWWKGNLHTHSFWSDGDDFPESIADWYKTNGYHFLALSDHNVTQTGQRWMTVSNRAAQVAFEKYLGRFGPRWVELRPFQPVRRVRLKTLQEFRTLFEEADRFLLIPSEEISDRYQARSIHLNATNLRHRIKPKGGTNVVDVLQRNIDAVLDQSRRTGVPMFPHVNHPNFTWAITAEDLMQVRGEQFFEIYNGHPHVRNEGDSAHASVERMWDIAMAFRLSRLGLGPLYGLAVDDAHRYHHFAPANSNPGRGWVMVRAPRLQAEAIIAAIEAGDFYASSGVRLKDVRRGRQELSVEIDAETGVTYTTQFIGTLEGFNPASQPGSAPTNSLLAVTRRYSEEIGTVLGVAIGPRASYTLQGDELYVRAKITSSKLKANPYSVGETEAAWTQPLIPMARE